MKIAGWSFTFNLSILLSLNHTPNSTQMETIRIKSITNTLPKHSIVFLNDSGTETKLLPGQSISIGDDLTLPFLPGRTTLDESLIRFFRTEIEGKTVEYTFICKQNEGIISALGTQQSDFHAPSNIHTSIPAVSPGDTISLTFNIDSDNVTWVIGEIDNI